LRAFFAGYRGVGTASTNSLDRCRPKRAKELQLDPPIFDKGLNLKKRLFCNSGSSILIVKPIGYMVAWYHLLKSYHVCEGMTQQDFFAAKTPWLEVEK